MPAKKPKKKPATKRKPKIDLDQIERMASMFCTEEDIAYVLGIDMDGLERRKKRNADIAAAIEKGRAQGRRSLRQKQYVMAMNGNVTMLMWLGRQYLGQAERPTKAAPASGPAGPDSSNDDVDGFTNEDLLKLARLTESRS